jgi:hypothetical protein
MPAQRGERANTCTLRDYLAAERRNPDWVLDVAARLGFQKGEVA